MKKSKILLALGVTVFLLTGCGNDKLVCEKTQLENSIENKSVAKYEFDGEKIKYLTLTFTTRLVGTKDVDKETFEIYSNYMQEAYKETFSDIKGIKVTEDKKDTSFTFTIKATNEGIEELEGSRDNDKEKVKTTLEGQGYTCK